MNVIRFLLLKLSAPVDFSTFFNVLYHIIYLLLNLNLKLCLCYFSAPHLLFSAMYCFGNYVDVSSTLRTFAPVVSCCLM